MRHRNIAESALELAVAQLRLAENFVEVEKQRMVISQLARDGQDTATAEALLTVLLSAQALREQLRETIKQEMERAA
jgi:hypothetical protein